MTPVTHSRHARGTGTDGGGVALSRAGTKAGRSGASDLAENPGVAVMAIYQLQVLTKPHLQNV